MWKFSIGDISKSRFWVSFQHRPWAWWRWWLSFAPTYNGTIRGIHIGLPFLTVIGHQRDTCLTGEQLQKQSYRSLTNGVHK